MQQQKRERRRKIIALIYLMLGFILAFMKVFIGDYYITFGILEKPILLFVFYILISRIIEEQETLTVVFLIMVYAFGIAMDAVTVKVTSDILRTSEIVLFITQWLVASGIYLKDTKKSN